VVRDEGVDLGFEIVREEVVLQQNAVLERLMPALDLSLVIMLPLGELFRSVPISPERPMPTRMPVLSLIFLPPIRTLSQVSGFMPMWPQRSVHHKYVRICFTTDTPATDSNAATAERSFRPERSHEG
jgi:hypothetical protein